MKTLKNLITCLSLALISQGAFAQDSKIGVLNALQSLFNSDAARVWQQELDEEFSVDVNRGNELGTQLAQMQEEYQQNEAVMTEEEKRRANTDAQDVQVQLQLIQERLIAPAPKTTIRAPISVMVDFLSISLPDWCTF